MAHLVTAESETHDTDSSDEVLAVQPSAEDEASRSAASANIPLCSDVANCAVKDGGARESIAPVHLFFVGYSHYLRRRHDEGSMLRK